MLLVLGQNKLLPSLIRDANDSIKLKNLLDFLFITTPIIPPSVVPNVPKNSPNIVVFIILSKFKNPFNIIFLIILKEFDFILFIIVLLVCR